MNLPSRTDPALLDLERRYAALNVFQHSNWESYANSIDIDNFRGERGYLSQLNYGFTAEHYARTFDYACSLGLKDDIVALGEDGAFGAIVFTSPEGIPYSRDLLDSVFELNFLRQTIGLTTDEVLIALDIGAGYGRFAHRFLTELPYSRVYCVDGVPLSTYLCEFYMNYRGLANGPAVTVPLDRLDVVGRVTLAVNMYSFAETTLSAVNFWLQYCVDRDIRYFFLEPHDYGFTDAALVTHEQDGSNINYYDRFEHYGYKPLRRTHKYTPRESSPLYEFGTEYLLWERKG